MRSSFRSSRLLLHVVSGLLTAARLRLGVGRPVRPEVIARPWHRHLLTILGVRVRVTGEPLHGGHLVVANHVSWLDIPVIGAHQPTRFVSKAEVQYWPIAGWLADAGGTFYIRRGRGDVRGLVDRLAECLEDGGCVTVFPEGTTSDGSGLLPFHPRLLAAAIEAQCPVQPVALRYAPTRNGRHLAPFVGDDDLLSHLLRLLRNRRLSVELIFLPPIHPTGLDRDALAACAEQAIRRALCREREAPSTTGRGRRQPIAA